MSNHLGNLLVICLQFAFVRPSLITQVGEIYPSYYLIECIDVYRQQIGTGTCMICWCNEQIVFHFSNDCFARWGGDTFGTEISGPFLLSLFISRIIRTKKVNCHLWIYNYKNPLEINVKQRKILDNIIKDNGIYFQIKF